MNEILISVNIKSAFALLALARAVSASTSWLHNAICRAAENRIEAADARVVSRAT